MHIKAATALSLHTKPDAQKLSGDWALDISVSFASWPLIAEPSKASHDLACFLAVSLSLPHGPLSDWNLDLPATVSLAQFVVRWTSVSPI